MKKLKPTPEELEELLKLVHKHNGFIFSDLRVAEQERKRAEQERKRAEQECKRAEQECKRAARNGCIFIHRTGASGTAPIIRGAIRAIAERERQHIEEIIKGGLTDENDRG